VSGLCGGAWRMLLAGVSVATRAARAPHSMSQPPRSRQPRPLPACPARLCVAPRRCTCSQLRAGVRVLDIRLAVNPWLAADTRNVSAARAAPPSHSSVHTTQQQQQHHQQRRRPAPRAAPVQPGASHAGGPLGLGGCRRPAECAGAGRRACHKPQPARRAAARGAARRARLPR
jgi:hypothetical protein